MSLRAQDIVLVLKLVAANSAAWSFSRLGKELSLSTSHAFESALRAQSAHLLRISTAVPSPPKARGVLFEPQRSQLKELLIHGVKYVFPVERGGMRGDCPLLRGHVRSMNTFQKCRRCCQFGLTRTVRSGALPFLRSTRTSRKPLYATRSSTSFWHW